MAENFGGRRYVRRLYERREKAREKEREKERGREKYLKVEARRTKRVKGERRSEHIAARIPKKWNGYCGAHYGPHKTPPMLEARGPKADLALRLPAPAPSLQPLYMKATCVLYTLLFCDFTICTFRVTLPPLLDICITLSHLFENNKRSDEGTKPLLCIFQYGSNSLAKWNELSTSGAIFKLLEIDFAFQLPDISNLTIILCPE